ncbi:MAG TPA: hypothetical protein VFB38_04690 [Chthonomonadaceae bacterium]|nr:hypothetical protein [Chthonomonadaceae bacterium]
MIALEELLAVLPAHQLQHLAVRFGLEPDAYVGLPGHVVFVCLLNALVNHPLATQRRLEQTYTQQTGTTADHSSVTRALARLNPAYFEAVFDTLYPRIAPKMRPGEANALRIRRSDATQGTLSAKRLAFGIGYGMRNGTAQRSVKSVIELPEERLPRLLHRCSQQTEHSDNRASGSLLPTKTRPGDL